MNAHAYDVSKINVREVLTLAEGIGTVDEHAYRDPNTAKKLRNKKYKGFSYFDEAQQYEDNEDNSNDSNYVNVHQ